MPASAPEKRKVFQLSGNVCAFSGCRLRLTVEATAEERLVALREVAHIVAESPDGPRGDSPLGTTERNQYENTGADQWKHILTCTDSWQIRQNPSHLFYVAAPDSVADKARGKFEIRWRGHADPTLLALEHTAETFIP
ncbi:hypothetical protein [Nocardia sp. CA-120079]|uniref:hypothetical protein n=1 Tax=Nocardia sp. CA-120079 TaxID=3239974 RepID=UPI003D9524F8